MRSHAAHRRFSRLQEGIGIEAGHPGGSYKGTFIVPSS
jgi:hypothetical protein